MSISTPSLIESLLLHDRPVAWWGLDTADPLTDDAVFDTDIPGYTLTALATPTDAASLHTRGDSGASGCRDFNGSTGGYFVSGTLYQNPTTTPTYTGLSSYNAVGAGTEILFYTGFASDVDEPGYKAPTTGVRAGDLMIAVINTSVAASSVTTAAPGWTQIGSTINYVLGTMAVYYRVADATDEGGPEHRFVWAGSGDRSGLLGSWRGLDPSVGASLIFDSGLQATSSGQNHFTTTETFPAGARQIVIWTSDGVDLAYQPTTGGSMRLAGVLQPPFSASSARCLMLDYEVASGDPGARWASTSSNTQLGAGIITFGSPQEVTRDELDTISEHFSCYFLCDPDTLSGTDTILYKHQSLAVDCSGTTLRFRYRDGGGVDRTVNGPTLSTAAGVYRVWVRDDGSNIYFTVNGTTTSSARTGTAGYTMNTNRWCIGHSFDGATTADFYDGKLDEIAIFPAFISNDMVSAHEEAATLGTFGTYIASNRSRSYPRAKVEIALTSRPTDSCPAFTNVTADLREEDGIQRTSGRNFESDRSEAGTLSVVLDNRDAVYSSLLPTRVIRFRAQTATDQPVIPRFYGYTDAPIYPRPGRGKDSTVILHATDVFKALSLEVFDDVFDRDEELIGERVRALLSGISGLRYSIDDGVHRVGPIQYQNSNRLEGVQSAVETDGGISFCDGRGRLVFQDNQHRTKNERTIRATYGWPGTTATYRSGVFEPQVDEARLFTAAAITPASGIVQTSVDATAELDYFKRTKQLSTIHADDLDALAMARHFSDAYSTPLVRVNSLELQPVAYSTPATMWATVLSHEISHRVKTIEKPVASAEIPREHFIEGISETLTASDWVVSFSLSPVELDGNYFIIGTSAIGGSDVIGW